MPTRLRKSRRRQAPAAQGAYHSLAAPRAHQKNH